MSNNKQSSIDILCGKLAMKLGIPQAITFYIDHQEEIAEAKAKHMEEIVQTYDDGIMKGRHEDGIEYYTYIFGSNKEQT